MYDLLDFFGDLGGVFEVFKTMILFFILPISEHIFILRVLKRLFYVKTRDENLFKNVRSNWSNKVQTLNETLVQKVDTWNKSARNILASSFTSSTV